MITNLVSDPFIAVCPIIPKLESLTQSYFQKRGVCVPTLQKIGGDDTWNVLFRPYRLQFSCSYGRFEFLFFEGFTTDWASVPKAFRGFIDNDDRNLMLPALVHDAMFKSKFFGTEKQGFDTANDIFEELMEWADMKPSTIDAVLASVSSWIGWSVYKKTFERDSEQFLNCEIREL
jgi:hypothetical protein